MKKIVLIIFVSITTTLATAQPILVKAMTHDVGGSLSNSFSGVGNNLYFNATSIVDSALNYTAQDLWISDGTNAGTKTVKNSNIYTSVILNAGNLTMYNGKLFFSAATTSATNTTGRELWSSDGTDAGTVLVKKINTPGNGSMAGGTVPLFEMGNKIYFMADDGTHGPEIWESDGTTAGTNLVKDITTGSNGSQINDFSHVNGKMVFFQDQNFIWVSDGTAAGTQQITGITTGNIKPVELNATTAVFAGAVAGSSNIEIWKTDGTLAGTTMIKDINSGNTSSFTSYMDIGAANGNAYFMADDGIHGLELWKTDGTSNGTNLVKDITPGSMGSTISTNFTGTSGKFFFSIQDSSFVYSLWATDGTGAGTVKLLNNVMGPNSAYNFVTVGNELLFTDMNRIYKSDGTVNGTSILDSIPNKYLSTVALVNNTLFVNAMDATDYGYELWKLDITSLQGIDNLQPPNDAITLFPNPAHNYLSILSTVKLANVICTNYSGQVVDVEIENNSINISSLSKGLYFLIISSGDGKISTQKFIKE